VTMATCAIVAVAEKFAHAMRRITIAKRKRAKENFRGFDVRDLNNSSASHNGFDAYHLRDDL